jgi:hypothetical protein
LSSAAPFVSLHPLVVFVGGRSIDTTAIQNPNDAHVWVYNATTGTYDAGKYPGSTEKWGLTEWREYLRKLNDAGFDVLTLDKRSHGVSGGLDNSNTVEQARDIFRAVDAFESGLRIAGADGVVLTGDAAAGKLLAGQKAKDVPMLIGGASQGSLATANAMYVAAAAIEAFGCDAERRGAREKTGFWFQGEHVCACPTGAESAAGDPAPEIVPIRGLRQ